MTNFRVHTGTVPGREHILKRKNSQDAVRFLVEENPNNPYVVGIVADGCGDRRKIGDPHAQGFLLPEKEVLYSETGANLLAEYVLWHVANMLNLGTWEISDIPGEDLYRWILQFLYGILHSTLLEFDLASMEERVNFINKHLLATIVGVIITPGEGLIFHYGDGVYVIGDEVTSIDYGDTPPYIAYNLLDKKGPVVSPIPQGFKVVTFDPTKISRVAIGTDAWKNELPLLDQVWGATIPSGVQRKLNVWSDRRHFEDDASIVVVEWDTQGE